MENGIIFSGILADRALDVIVLTAMGEEAAIDAKEAPKSG